MAPVTIWTAPGGADPASGTLTPARDLAADGRAAADGRPILVLFSETGCPWCERARREFLLPMQGNAAYRAKVVFRQIDIDRTTPLRGFDGAMTSHQALAGKLKVSRFPTVMLFGPDGRLLAEPLVGFAIADFYGAYLDERIDSAAAKLAAESEPKNSSRQSPHGR